MPARKSPAKGSVKKTKKTTKQTSDSKTRNYRHSYVKLRTIIDALEMGSLRYFLSGGSDEERDERAKKLIDLLRPVVKQIEDLDKGTSAVKLRAVGGDPGSECPPGYYECDGCCVPYPCPGGKGSH